MAASRPSARTVSSKPPPEDSAGPVFIISGAIGAGKSTVSEHLMARFPRGVHIPVDDLRSFVVSGYADPVAPWTEETDLQFRLARETAASMAAAYAAAGFAVAIDDIVTPGEVEELFLPALQGYKVHRVLLRPSLDVALHRNATRSNKTFDTAVLTDTLRLVHGRLEGLRYAERGWQVMDTGDVSVEATVDRILRVAGIGEA